MQFKDKFNRLARTVAPMALIFAAAVTASGCATVSPPRTQMGPDNIAYIQQGLDFYRQTGVSPVNYDACGALQDAVEGRDGSGGGALTGAVIGGVVAHQIARGPIPLIAGILGGGAIGNQVERSAGGGNVDQLNKDCQLQQAISRASGGSVRGGSVTYQPGGIYRRY